MVFNFLMHFREVWSVKIFENTAKNDVSHRLGMFSGKLPYSSVFPDSYRVYSNRGECISPRVIQPAWSSTLGSPEAERRVILASVGETWVPLLYPRCMPERPFGSRASRGRPRKSILEDTFGQ